MIIALTFSGIRCVSLFSPFYCANQVRGNCNFFPELAIIAISDANGCVIVFISYVSSSASKRIVTTTVDL